jgi:hypothetical protein
MAKPLQLRFGRSHHEIRPLLPQKLDVLLADHPPIQHPDSLRLAILPLHHRIQSPIKPILKLILSLGLLDFTFGFIEWMMNLVNKWRKP